MSYFNDPTPGWMTVGMTRWGKRLSLARLGGDMGGEAVLLCRGTTRGRVVPPVQAQMPFLILSKERDGHHNGGEDVGELFAVVAVGSAENDRQGNAFGVGQQGPFTSGFAPVGGVGAGGFKFSGSPLFPNGALMMQPSASCHSQSIPSNSPYS